MNIRTHICMAICCMTVLCGLCLLTCTAQEEKLEDIDAAIRKLERMGPENKVGDIDLGADLPLPELASAKEIPDTAANRYDILWEKTRKRYINLVADHKGSRWHAEILDVAGDEKIEEGADYATSKYGDAWDFDEGDFEGIAEFRGIPTPEELDDGLLDNAADVLLLDDDAGAGKSIATDDGLDDAGRQKTGRQVKNGILSFTTRKGACFFWGDHFGTNREYGREPVTGGRLRIRVRQSARLSSWRIIKRGGGSTSFVLEGTDWQTRIVDMGAGRSLCIMPGEADNFVEIDWITLVPRRLTKYFRKTIELTEDVRDAHIYSKNESSHTIYINGKEVFKEQWQRYSSIVLHRTELKDCLRKGKNVIAMRASAALGDDYQTRMKRNFFLEGVITTVSGRIIRIYTDKTWKSTYVSQPGWEEPDFDDVKWRVAESKGKVQNTWVGREVYGGKFMSPPYMGPIGLDPVGRSTPIYGFDEPVAFNVILPKRTYTDGKYDLGYRIDYVTGEFDQHEVAAGKLTDHTESGSGLVYPLKRALSGKGVYELHLVLAEEDGTPVDTRVEEFVVVGPTGQREVDGKEFGEGMDLKLVDTIDCTSTNDRHRFTTAASYDDDAKKGTVGMRVVEKEFGKYLELGRSDPWTRMTFHIEMQNPTNVHVIEIEYPDSGRRSLICAVNEYPLTEERADHRLYWRSSFPIYTGGKSYPATKTMQKMQLLYWPRKCNAMVDLYNLEAGCRVAVSQVRVYEILNGLPALRISNPDADRRLGGQSERDTTVTHNFYQGGLGVYFGERCLFPRKRFYYDWYVTLDNMTRYLKFCGDNVYVSGAYMYEKALYPTKKYGNGDIVAKDYRDLMAKMFEYNGIDVLLGVQFAFTRPFYRRGNYSTDDVRLGAATPRLVSKTGEQAYNTLTKSGLNWFSPEVQSVAMSIFKEILGCYAEYPSVKGLAMYTAQSMYPATCLQTKSSRQGPARGLDFGYGDVTVARFEKETGINVPVDKKDHARFQQRYDWLMANEKEKWVDWRCNTLHANVMQVYDAMKEMRQDLELHMIGIGPMWTTRTEWLKGKISYKEACEDRGVDPHLYSGRKDIVGYTALVESGDWKKRRSIVVRDPTQGDDILTAHGPHPIGQYFVRNVAPHGWGMVPGHKYATVDRAKSLCHSTPVTMIHGKADCIYMQGSEQEMRTFTRSYRSIPSGEYQDVKIEGGPDRILARALRRKDDYCFYVVNMRPDAVNVRATLEVSSGGVTATDVVTGEPADVGAGPAWGIDMAIAPFAVRVFSVRAPDAGLTGLKIK